MASKKNQTLTADYEKDTAKGKRRYRIGESGDAVVGTIYISDGHPCFEADTVNVTLTPVSDE